MKKPIVLGLTMLAFVDILHSQDAETTTYFAEKSRYQIDFPTDWTVSVVEKKVMVFYNTSLAGIQINAPYRYVMINSTLGCKSPSAEMKTWKHVFEKDAKKDNDAAYVVHDEGESTLPDGTPYSFIDYNFTLHEDDGGSVEMHRKFYVVCHWGEGGNKYDNAMTFQCKASEWDTAGPLLDTIFKSAHFIKK